ncbi:PaaI family thioesterase [Pontibacter sp. G13]|uniref:PaaI family thioesterase n=1 Tax=Pontibacter sp. G13 TaxID=3074898 RepID=UPI00288BB324|nr:PaaI family thioesterase [Pontibacter sp. G13]WNJ21003.1 PaaI family thioesterase [Pontibacter sp. G13]
MKREYFQDHLPDKKCFGCGTENAEGLQIKSYWEGDEAVCFWTPKPHHHGWTNILNGGILGTIIDCHCMGTAMAGAYRAEGRSLDSDPKYRYATGTMTVKYLKPTSNLDPVELRATIREIKGKKTVMECRAYSNGVQTALAEVIAIRVVNTNESSHGNPFQQGQANS